MDEKSFTEAGKGFANLLSVMEKLRSPTGCSWDRKQTHNSLNEHLQEETSEVIEAVNSGNPVHMKEELGDLSMLIAFHCVIALEKGTFTPEEVFKGIVDKLISRHPHVFGENPDLKDPQQVVAQWNQLKVGEKAMRKKASFRMNEAAGFSSPIVAAINVQTEAAGEGFDFPNLESAVTRIEEETEEFKGAAHGKASEELGDLLFSVLNVARLAGINPEAALRQSTKKFVNRYKLVESELENKGGVASFSMDELDQVWNRIKKN